CKLLLCIIVGNLFTAFVRSFRLGLDRVVYTTHCLAFYLDPDGRPMPSFCCFLLIVGLVCHQCGYTRYSSICHDWQRITRVHVDISSLWMHVVSEVSVRVRVWLTLGSYTCTCC
ncbi:unnamed protein product, partial [Ectocarpus fasciculatus]